MSYVSLTSVASVVRGVTFSKSEGESYPSTGKLPIIRAGSIQVQLLLDEGQIWVPKEKIKDNQKIRRNDIIMCTSSGSSNLVGKCAKSNVDFEGSFGAFCIGIRPNPEKISPSYLFHFLSSPKFRHWTKNSSGANIKNIRVSELAEFKIPLPPLTEQKRIAAILDKADTIRRKRQQAIQLADDFLRAVFLNMFGDPVTNPKGWEVHPLESVCVAKQGIKAGPFGSALKKEVYTSNGYRVYGQEQVIGGNFSIGDYYIDAEKYAEMAVYAIQPGDLLISLVGSIGKTLIVPEDVEPGIINPRLLRIRAKKEKLNPEFFQFLLKQPNVQTELKKHSHGGTMAVLNATMLKEFNIIVPPVNMQERFSNFVQEYSALLDKLMKMLVLHDSIFNSLSQRAFRGEL